MNSRLKRWLIGLTIITVAIFAVVVSQGWGETADTALQSSEADIPETVELATSTEPIMPERLRIPSIGVDAEVESVGVDETGNMAVPSDWRNVAWYEPGFAPGEVGNAVFAGHLDWDGNEAVFWDLQTLEPGIVVMVWGDNRQLTYIITEINEYDYQLSDTERVFGAEDVSQIKLITCDGEFIEGSDTYEKRLIVTAQLVRTAEE